jgi:coenzyme PQQ precursor peptide PqqA
LLLGDRGRHLAAPNAGAREGVTTDPEAAKFDWRRPSPGRNQRLKEKIMSWTAPVVVEVCAGLEVTAYLTAEM